mgnify:CR=1 FL=1
MHELTSAAVALMVCVAAGSYLAGCCNGAIITSFLFYHDDIRKHGSHNAGLTNFYRVYGGKFAVCVILIELGIAPAFPFAKRRGFSLRHLLAEERVNIVL